MNLIIAGDKRSPQLLKQAFGSASIIPVSCLLRAVFLGHFLGKTIWPNLQFLDLFT